MGEGRGGEGRAGEATSSGAEEHAEVGGGQSGRLMSTYCLFLFFLLEVCRWEEAEEKKTLVSVTTYTGKRGQEKAGKPGQA